MNRFLCLFLLLLAAHVTACQSSKPVGVTDERPGLLYASRPVGVDSMELLKLPVKSDELIEKPGVLSGIGKLFSTPEGTARRQARKLAKAAVPRSIGKGAVYAPLATEVVNAYKPRAAVVNADSGAVVTAIGKNKGAAATGTGASATQTIEKPGFPWGRVGLGLGAFGFLVLLFGTPVGPWLVALVKRRKKDDAA